MADKHEQSPPPFADFGTSSGARFHRVDLHIHSHPASVDVEDAGMTVEGIVARALERSIGLLAVTDHNSIDAVPELIAAGEASGLAVIAGVELSTADGHVLVYFDPEDLAGFQKWFARLDFREEKDRGERWLLEPIHEIAKSVEAAGGLAVPAHAGRNGSGCLAKANSKAQDAIIASPHICAIEVDGPHEFDWFTAEDRTAGHDRRKEQLARRRKALGETVGPRLAKLYFSDAHSLEQIGRNREDAEWLTRVKMTEPSFRAFKLALRDPGARIRLEQRLPESYSRLVGARFIGGFLDGEEVAFSENLTCLIGGRGAGKSTALEAVRSVCLNTPHERELAEDPEWPQTVQVIYEDHFGERHHVQKSTGEQTLALDDEDAVQCTIPIDGYAQDRVAEIIRSYGEDSSLLGAFLDGFTELAPLEERVAALGDQLASNAAEILPLGDPTARRKAAETTLSEVQLKLKAVEKSKLKEALAYRRRLTQERRLRAALQERLAQLEQDITAANVEIDVEALALEVDAGELGSTPSKKFLLGHGAETRGLIELVSALQGQLQAWKRSGGTKLAQARPDIDETIAKWQAYDQRVEARYQKIISDLRASGVNPDVKQLNKLTDDETKAKDTITKAEGQELTLARLRRERRKLLTEYRAAQDARFYERQQATKELTSTLNRSIHEFKVKLGFERGASHAAYERWLRDAMRKRFFRGERVGAFCRQLHPIELAEILNRNAKAKLLALTDAKGTPFLGADVEEFIERLREAGPMELEQIDISDAPRITLTTPIDGKMRTVEFARLSFGQKASILLGALLCSDDTAPLIIDQPEDHLDSAFIFETIVSTLRNIKERRQVILATHNANIAVLGDAELIVPLQGYGNVGHIRERGAVDAEKTRDRACKILEGGASAYERRGEMYGLRAG